MNTKLNIQQQMTNGMFIKKEIQRFESVHPNIYSIYDLIDTITDFNLQQQIREHIVNIEDSFVNSQEWTLSRTVPDIKLGILGAVTSGKSALVHRFLTGTYMQEESTEGGRFKKEAVIDGQSYLLLIRDEGGAPEMQFTHWVDAVIFVFSLENEESFMTIHQYYLKMTHYRNMADIPFILVGTQDFINETSPRCIDETRARNLANELKRCIYYETCATYGLHVERVFHDACQKVVAIRTQYLYNLSLLLSNNQSTTVAQHQQQQKPGQLHHGNASISTSSIRLLAGQLTNTTSSTTTVSPTASASSTVNAVSPTVLQNAHNSLTYFQANPNIVGSVAIQSSLINNNNFMPSQQSLQNGVLQKTNFFHPNQNVFKEPLSMNQHFMQQQTDKRGNRTDTDTSSNKFDIITPCSTPNQKRKDTNRRRSNIFTPNKKEEKNKLSDMGIGRSIPIKQGFLYKKTNSTINKDWKKKFVTLNDDGSLRYYPSMNDYMEDVHGKEIEIQKTTIKMPGANKPRIGKTITVNDANKLTNDINLLDLNGDKNGHFYDEGIVIANSSIVPSVSTHQLTEQPQTTIPTNFIGRNLEFNSKKRHRRIKSTHKTDQNKDGDAEEGGFEFIIVSYDNKQWHFEAATYEEREEWVQAIEQQILSSLQSNETNKFKNKLGGISADNFAIQTMKNVPGNNACVDCDAPNPVWATLNYGALICIECSGIHRNLGTHLSRVRSLELDDWSNELIQVMTSIGNKMINSIFEGSCKGRVKPNPNSIREEKEKWIRAKYETKQFLMPLTNKDSPIGKQLIEAVQKQDVALVLLLLSHSKPEDVNACISPSDKRTSLHVAASIPNTVITQLLIWYGADVDCIDSQGKNALSHAKNSNSSECTQLLLFNGSQDLDQNSANPNQLQPALSRRSQSTLNNQANGNSNSVILEKLAFNVL